MSEADRFIASIAFAGAVVLTFYLLASFILHMIKWKRNAMRKTYGPEQIREIPKIPFSLNVEHEIENGRRELRTHEFVGRPDPSSGDFARFTIATMGQGAEVVEALMAILPRMIDNSDGVSATWQYHELDPAPVADGEEPGENRFYGPDGQMYPVSEAKRFTAFEAGSSRRRLYHLLFVDPDARVQIQTVVEIMKDLMAEGAGRPTSA